VAEAINPADRRLHLPFDRYQRYRLVADVLERLREGGGALGVLEVGGGQGAIRDFLDEVTVADGGAFENVPGDAAALPFGDGSFDFVASVDAFGRVAPAAREGYLSELRRVARKGVLLASPFEGSGVREAQELAGGFSRYLDGRERGRAEEPAEHVLPDLGATRTFYEGLGDSVTVLPNGYLPHWLTMTCVVSYGARGEDGLSRTVREANHFYNRFLYEHDNVEPCYRYVIVALKEPAPARLEDLTSRAVDPTRANLASALLGSLTATLPLGAELRELNARLARTDLLLERKEAQIRDLSRRLARQVAGANTSETSVQQALRQENQSLRRQRDSLSNELETITRSRAWRVARLLGRLRRLGR
jgi:SAM-dependent methyltransferase